MARPRKKAKRKPRAPLRPSGRNPYAVATKRLGHGIKPSAKAYRRRPRTPRDEEDGAAEPA